MSEETVIDDTELQKLLEEQNIEIEDDISTEYKTAPSYVYPGVMSDDILKTEIVICEKCMHANIVGSEPFNRREKELKQLKLDSVVYPTLMHFAKVNKLDMNSTVALLLKVAQDPEVAKKIMGSFLSMPKRKGKRERSNSVLISSSSLQALEAQTRPRQAKPTKEAH